MKFLKVVLIGVLVFAAGCASTQTPGVSSTPAAAPDVSDYDELVRGAFADKFPAVPSKDVQIGAPAPLAGNPSVQAGTLSYYLVTPDRKMFHQYRYEITEDRAVNFVLEDKRVE